MAKKDKEEEWKEYKRKYFLIYYRNAPLDFVKTVAESAEDYYSEIADSLGFVRYNSWAFDERAKIYIFDHREDYIENARQASWSHGAASARRKTIYTFPSAHGFFDSTLPHELGHIIFREFIGHKAAVPVWFEEGVAMYQERARRWGAHRDVKIAIETGRFIPLPKLNRMRPTSRHDVETVKLFYAQSASLVNYLITEYGKFRFTRFCRELEGGKRFEDALVDVYFSIKDLEDLNQDWIDFLENVI